MSIEEAHSMLDFVARIGSSTLLLVPLGAGPECLGYMVLTRSATDPSWNKDEHDAALRIGRDIGRAVLHARLYEREREVVEELKQVDRYKNEFVSTVSHELKNPLTSIVGHLELNAVLKETADMLHPQAARRGIDIDLESIVRPATVQGDPAELERVTNNLVSNAIKFSPEGATVRLRLESTDDTVVFSCCDQGIGISRDEQKNLFTEFYRTTNSVARAVPGTGLGLAIVKRIVVRHHGTITVESEIGAGSMFTVTIPRSTTAAGPPVR